MKLLNITEIHGHLSHSGTGVWLDTATHDIIMGGSEQITTANSVNQTGWHQIELDQNWTNANQNRQHQNIDKFSRTNCEQEERNFKSQMGRYELYHKFGKFGLNNIMNVNG